MKVYDISQEVLGCQVFPGDPAPHREVLQRISEGSACNLSSFGMCAHNGTHVDAPYHFVDSGRTLDQMDLEHFVGPAYVAEHEGKVTAQDARAILEKAARAAADSGDCKSRENCEKCDKRILIKGKAVLSPEAAEVFARARLLLYGNESQTVGDNDTMVQIHHILLGADMALLEGVRLGEVPEGRYLLSAAPLNLGGAEGAPCRAVLIDCV